MTQYRFTSAAFTELRQATLYYEQRENGLGLAFLNEIEATLNRILQHPTAWHQLSSVMDLRRDPARWKDLL
jgi:predicted SprT family Zn-dependent metalloprotease